MFSGTSLKDEGIFTSKYLYIIGIDLSLEETDSYVFWRKTSESVWVFEHLIFCSARSNPDILILMSTKATSQDSLSFMQSAAAYNLI